MRGVENIFIRTGFAFDYADDIFAIHFANVIFERQGSRHTKRHRFETLVLRSKHHFCQILTSTGKNLARNVLLNPAIGFGLIGAAIS